MTTPQRFVAGAVDLGQFSKSNQQASQQTQDDLASGAVTLASTVTKDTFESDLVLPSTKVLVVAHIGSARSPESEQMRGYFQQMVQQQEGADPQDISWLYRYVDVDTQPEIAQAFKLSAVPTVIALAGGRPFTQFEGAEGPEQLQQWVEALLQAVDGKLPGLGEESQDPRFAQAADLIDSGDTDGAIAVYDALLAEDPKNAEAIAARAQALMVARINAADRTGAGDGDVTDTGAGNSGAGDDPFVQADRLIVAGDKAAGFALLVEQIKQTSGEQREAAKNRLFELFTMYEAGDPDVISARTAMASALF